MNPKITVRRMTRITMVMDYLPTPVTGTCAQVLLALDTAGANWKACTFSVDGQQISSHRLYSKLCTLAVSGKTGSQVFNLTGSCHAVSVR